MNEPRVRTVPEMNGYRGEFRKLDKSGWHAVEVNGIAQLYESEEKAMIAAYEAMNRYHFGAGILREGEKATVANAEAAFAKIFPGHGRRPFVVERR